MLVFHPPWGGPPVFVVTGREWRWLSGRARAPGEPSAGAAAAPPAAAATAEPFDKPLPETLTGPLAGPPDAVGEVLTTPAVEAARDSGYNWGFKDGYLRGFRKGYLRGLIIGIKNRPRRRI